LQHAADELAESRQFVVNHQCNAIVGSQRPTKGMLEAQRMVERIADGGSDIINGRREDAA
jgi:hypothetical protein